MNGVEQLELLTDSDKPLRTAQPVSLDVIYRQPDRLSAIKLAVQVSGLDEKQIYMALGLDKASWSKIMSGQFNFPTNKEEQFYDIVGNEIPLIWLAYRRGKGLHDLEDAKDKTIRELQQSNDDLRREIDTLVKYGVLQRGTDRVHRS